MRTRARVDPRREAPLDQLGDRRARDQHALVDVERQPGEPRFVREIGQRHALVDAPRQQRLERARAARRVTRRVSTRGGASCGSSMHVQHQRRRFIAWRCRCRARSTRARAAGAACALAIRSPARLMWNNRAMSNRYWISVGADRRGRRSRRRVRGAHAEPARRAFARGGHVAADAARARRTSICVDTQGAPAPPAPLRGHPTLVFFGFTHCPDVCPTTLALLASVQKQVAIPGLKVALISVDPERDTPQQLGKYISSFGGDLIGLTGTAPEIVNATKSFGVAASRVDLPGGDYTMDHSATVFVLDSGARIVAVFTPPLQAARAARATSRGSRRCSDRLSAVMSEPHPAPAAARSSRSSTCCRNTASRAWCSPRRVRARRRSRTR